MKITRYNIKAKYAEIPVNIKASFWFLASAFFQRGIAVITTPIFTRLMSTAEYGEFSVFYSWYGIITVVVSLNLFYGVYMRGLVKFEGDQKIFSSSMEGLTCTLVIGWLLIYLVFRKFFNGAFSLTTPQMLCMFLIIWSNGAFCFWAAEQRVKLNYKVLVGLSCVTVIATPTIQLFLMSCLEDKVMARIYGMTVVNVILYVPLFIKQMWGGKKFFSKKYWIYGLKFNIPLVPHYLSQTVLNSADRIMINNMVGFDESGIYSLAYSIAQIMTMFNSALMQTIEPWLYKKIRDNQVTEIKKVAYPSFVLVAVVNLLLILCAPEVIAIFAPKSYYDAIWVIPPVAMSVFFQFTYTFFAVFEFYYEKTQYITLATVIGALLNILLNYIFIGKYGYYAAGYTTLICFIFYSMFHYIFMCKLIKKNFRDVQVYSLKIILIIACVFLAIGFTILGLYSHRLIRYITIVSILGTLFIKRKSIMLHIKRIIQIRQDFSK